MCEGVGRARCVRVRKYFRATQPMLGDFRPQDLASTTLALKRLGCKVRGAVGGAGGAGGQVQVPRVGRHCV